MRVRRSGHIGDARPRGEYLAAARSRHQPFPDANDRRNNNYVNQITQRSVAGGAAVTFEHDNNSSPLPGNGNLTYDGTLNYQYDALNRLIAVNRVSDGAAIAAYVYDAMNRRVRKTITNGGLAGNIPNGTTDSCWLGWQTMEERNPYGGSGSTDTPTKEYIWGTHIDECIQIHLLVPAGPQQLAIGVYYPLQDTLYRTMALANSSGTPVEAYDTDAYGNTIIFTGPGPDNTWFTDDDTQSSYGANDIIYCGYRYDAETENYYVRNRYYSPTLGRWLTRDPIGYRGGINLYGYVDSSPVGNVDAEGASLWTALGGALGGLGSQLGMLAEEALSAYNRAITALMLESLPPYVRTLPICKIPPLAHSPYHGPTFMKSETKGNFGPAGGSVSGGVSVPIRGTPFSVWGYGSGSLSPNGTFAPTKGMLGLSF